MDKRPAQGESLYFPLAYQPTFHLSWKCLHSEMVSMYRSHLHSVAVGVAFSLRGKVVWRGGQKSPSQAQAVRSRDAP